MSFHNVRLSQRLKVWVALRKSDLRLAKSGGLDEINGWLQGNREAVDLGKWKDSTDIWVYKSEVPGETEASLLDNEDVVLWDNRDDSGIHNASKGGGS